MGLVPYPRPPKPGDPKDLERYKRECVKWNNHERFRAVMVGASLVLLIILIIAMEIYGQL